MTDEELLGSTSSFRNKKVREPTEDDILMQKIIDEENTLELMKGIGVVAPTYNEKKEEINAPSARAFVESSDTLSAAKTLFDTVSPRNLVNTVSDAIQQDGDFLDNLRFGYNKNYAQRWRDDLGINDGVQNTGAFYQPNFVIDPATGRKVMTGNKSFNNFTDEELQYIEQEQAKKAGDEFYYEMETKDGNLTKKGYSSDEFGAFDRYNDDPNFFEKWQVTKNEKTGNAKEIERLQHGAIKSRLSRSSNYTDKNKIDIPLIDGRTEVYGTEALFKNRLVEKKTTPVQEQAVAQVDNLLDDNQKQIIAEVQQNTGTGSSVDKPNIGDMEVTQFWNATKNAKNPQEMVELLVQRKQALDEKKDTQKFETDGTLTKIGKGFVDAVTPSDGAMSESMLETMPGYQQLAQSIDGEIFNLGGYKATPQEKAENLSAMLSGMNWNLTTMMSKIPQLRGNKKLAGDLADALEAYSTTTVDPMQVVRGAGNTIIDPSNAVGFAISGAKKLFGGKAAQETLIQQLKRYAGRVVKNPTREAKLATGKAIRLAKSDTSKVGITGAGFTGVYDAGMQTIKIIGGKQDEFNFEENGKAMGMGFAAGVGLAKTIKAMTGKVDATPQVTVNEFDTMIAQMTKKAGDNSLPREERGLYRKEVVRMRKYRDKVAAIKENADMKENMRKQMKIIEDMKVDIAREAKRAKVTGIGNYKWVKELYGLETFEKTKKTKKIVEDTANMQKRDDMIDNQIDTKRKQLEPENAEKEIPETESLEAVKFEDTDNLVRETRQPVKDRGKELVDQSTKIDSIPNKTKEIEVETRGASKRGYQKDGYLDGHQQGKTGFSQMRMRNEKPNLKSVDSVNTHISEKVKRFQEKDEMISTYGQNAAKEVRGAKKPSRTPEQKLERRLSYELNEIGRLMADKKISPEVRTSLIKRAKDLMAHGKSVRKKGVMTKDMKKAISKFEREQYKPGHEYDNSARNTEVKEQYKFLKDAGEVKDKKSNQYSDWSTKQKYSPYNSVVDNGTRRPTTSAEKNVFIRKLYKNMKQEQRLLARDVGKLEAQIRKELLAKGIQDDLSILPEKGVDMDAVRQIQKYRDITDDIKAFENKEIKHEELLYRQSKRMDNEIDTLFTKERKNGDVSPSDAMENVAKKYEELGLGVKPSTSLKEVKGSGGVPDPAKVLERELAEKRDIATKNQKQLSKFLAFEKRNFTQKRRTDTKRGQEALETVTKNQADMLEAGITPQELADMQFPPEATNKTLDYWKKFHKKQINTKLNEKARSRLGIPSDIRFMENPPKLTFEETMIDASNSMLQMMAVLTRSKNFGKWAKLTGTNDDVRTVIGQEMSNYMELPKYLNEDGKPGSWKDFVKPLFMTENYGQGEKGLVNTLINRFQFDYNDAVKFYANYKKASDKIFPEIKAFRDIVNQRMKRTDLGSEMKWTMPDGEEIKLDISKDIDGKWSIRSLNGEFTVKTSDLDTFSASLMPSYIQSYDAWVAKKMRERGYATNHDAFVPGEFKTEKQMQDDYGEILSMILDSDSFVKNMKELNPGGKVNTKKLGDLSKDDVMQSMHKMEVEHGPKDIDVAKERKIENSTWKTDEELMRDFMASSNIRQIDTHSLTDSIVDNIGNNVEYAKVMEKQDPFERQAALATMSENYNPELSIPAPKGVDKKTWDLAQRNIFYESRAKLEQNPNAKDVLEGNRVFFQENGKPIGQVELTRAEVELMFRKEDFKSRQEYNKAIRDEKKRIKEHNREIQKAIIELENKKGEAIYKTLTTKEKVLTQRIGKTYIQMARRVKSWHPMRELSNAEAFAKATVEEARRNIASNGKTNSLLDKEKMQFWNAYYVRQVVENNPSYKQLQELNNLAKKFGNDSARYKEGIQKMLEKDIPKAERETWYKHLIDTDYAAIDGITKKAAEKFMKDYADDYKLAKRYIDASAKSLGTPENQNGFYQNNALGIVRKLGISEDMVPIYDKMISIKAMTDEAWKFVDEKKNTPEFRRTMDRIKYNQTVSRDILFKNNPESYIKGYTRQVTNPNYTLNEAGQKVYTTDPGRARGHLDVELENKKRGREIGELTDKELKEHSIDLWNRVEEIEKEIAPNKRARQELNKRTMHDNVAKRDQLLEMQKDGPLDEKNQEILDSLIKSIDTYRGKMKSKGFTNKEIDKTIKDAGPRSAREIEVMKDSVDVKKAMIETMDTLNEKTGKALDLNRPITDEHMAIAEKRRLKLTEKDVKAIAGKEIREDLGRTTDIVKVLTETLGDTEVKLGRRRKIEIMKQSNLDLLYSKTSKPGFEKLSDEILNGLPRELREDAKYVNKEFYTQLVGRENVSLSKNASHGWQMIDRLIRDATTRFKKNNVLSNSASHVNALMYNQAIAPSIGITPQNQVKWQKEAVQQIQEITKIFERIADLHSRGKNIDKLMKKLEKNELYQMEQNGLSTNTIDGIAQEPDLWRQIMSDGLGKVEKTLGTKFDNTRTIMNNFFAEGDSMVGQAFNKSFTVIDTTGRYMTTKQFMSQGMSLTEATRKTNGLFGDMDQIAPAFIDFLDKYPAIPFMKWWTSIAPQTVKTLGIENPGKALLMGMLVYAIMIGSKDKDSNKGSGIRTTGANPILSNIDFLHDSTIGAFDDFMNDYNRNTSVGEKVWRKTGKYALPSFLTKPTNQLMIDKSWGDIAKGFVFSNASENYANIKGSPLETKGITDELIHEKVFGKPHFKQFKRN